MTKVTLEQQEKGKELYQELVQKAWESASFKEELISNPKDVIESFTEKKLNIPNNTKLIVEDQTNDDFIFLNIPRKIESDNYELTNKQLDLVAGGTHPDEGHSPNLVYEVFYHGTKMVMSWFADDEQC